MRYPHPEATVSIYLYPNPVPIFASGQGVIPKEVGRTYDNGRLAEKYKRKCKRPGRNWSCAKQSCVEPCVDGPPFNKGKTTTSCSCRSNGNSNRRSLARHVRRRICGQIMLPKRRLPTPQTFSGFVKLRTGIAPAQGTHRGKQPWNPSMYPQMVRPSFTTMTS
jgi:hypothetical protein